MTNLFCRYYSSVGPRYGFFKVSIDDSAPQRLTAYRDVFMSQQLIWSNTSLGPGKHNLTLTHDGDIGVFCELDLDFFRSVINNVRRQKKTSDSRYLPSLSHSVLPGDGTSVSPTNQNPKNTVPLAVGLTFGLLALVVIALGTVCYLYRRKRRTLIDLDVQSVSPDSIPPMKQASQQSSVAHDGECRPQPDRPSDVPIAIDGLGISSSGMVITAT